MKDLRELVIEAELENNPKLDVDKLRSFIYSRPMSEVEQDAIDLGIIPNPECD